MSRNLFQLSTPGEVLKDEFLDPMGITPYALAKSIFVDPPRIAAIIKGKRKITADTAIKLSSWSRQMSGEGSGGVMLDHLYHSKKASPISSPPAWSVSVMPRYAITPVTLILAPGRMQASLVTVFQ
ncbi:MAG: HigA family addiction module antitoxin [Spirochaetota bacterium]